jgi:hypothetical protein
MHPHCVRVSGLYAHFKSAATIHVARQDQIKTAMKHVVIYAKALHMRGLCRVVSSDII